MSFRKSSPVTARPTISKDLAQKILNPVPPNQAFSFYIDIGKPTGKYATNLQNFSTCLRDIAPQSVAFHLERGDFQNWINKTVGDKELATRLSNIKAPRMSPEKLRAKVYNEIKTRYDELLAALT